MVFNATLNNISAISWRWVVLLEETEYSEKITDMSQVTDKLYHKNVVSRVRTHNFSGDKHWLHR